MRGHSTSYYVDIGLMAVGALVFLSGNAMLGLLLAGLGVVIHVAMGD